MAMLYRERVRGEEMLKSVPIAARLVVLLSLNCATFVHGAPIEKAVGSLNYELTLETIYPPYDGEGNWFQPRPVAIPAAAGGTPSVVMTIQRAIGSDYFTGLAVSRTDDLGKTWTQPEELPQLGWRDAAKEGFKIGVCDFTQALHAPTGKVVGIGHTVHYTTRGFAGYGNRRDSTYAIYDPKTDVWTPWTVLEMPKTDDDKYFFNGVHGQWLVEPDGSLLVPIYYVGPNQPFLAKGVVMRFAFDGKDLTFVERGADLVHDVKRGLYEKSLTFFQGKYYMTMRNDLKGFVAVSDDGLNFGPIKAWTFDDGRDLGSYNTQQKWVTHSDGLFLVYTRRGANNDHIMRHRAPLFIAQVDPDRLCVLRDTERIAVPEEGKLLGNFDATTINGNETWITVAGGEAFCARIRWSRPNGLAGRVN
jgi:hypothetical protein